MRKSAKKDARDKRPGGSVSVNLPRQLPRPATAAAPFDVHSVALDAESMVAAGWPNPSAVLRRLGEVLQLLGTKFWIIRGAVEEVRGRALRNVDLATEHALRMGFDNAVIAREKRAVMSRWEDRHESARRILGAGYVNHPPRSLEELFQRGVDRIPPFDKRGRGFRDTVIYLSVVDELKRLGLSTAILVTNDSDFSDCQSPVAGQTIHIMNLESTVSNFERLLENRQSDVAAVRRQHDQQRSADAAAAIMLATPEIERFVHDSWSVSAFDTFQFGGVLRRMLSCRVKKIVSVVVSPLEAPPGSVVEVTAHLEMIGDLELTPFMDTANSATRTAADARLRAGSTETPATVTLREQSFHVLFDCEMTRTLNGYSDVNPRRMYGGVRGLISHLANLFGSRTDPAPLHPELS